MQMRSRGTQPTRRVRTIDFHEALAPTMPRPAMPAPRADRSASPARSTSPARTKTSPNYVRGAMIVLWVLAAIAAGAGIGAMIIANRTVVSTTPGLPVAKGNVQVANLAAATLVPATSATTSDLKVVSATDVDQSQLSNFWPVAQADKVQPSNGPLALQPGFMSFGPGQGGNGTDPVVIR